MDSSVNCVIESDNEVDRFTLNDGNENDEQPNFDQDHEGCSKKHSVTLEESEASNFHVSPGGTRYWTPKVSDELKPVVGAKFGSLQDATDMYYRYAEKAGFEVRLSTTRFNEKTGLYKYRYLLCNRNGKPRKRVECKTTSGKQRNTSFKVTDCKACLRLRLVEGSTSYTVYHFVEDHNHKLIEDVDRSLTRKGRKLDFSEQQFIHRASSSNIGPVKAHNIQTSLKGGYDNLGATSVDYKNFNRDLRCYVGDADCQMVIENFENRSKHDNRFMFEYRVEKKELSGLFWADGLARANYNLFGDVMSFDATYRTNMYAMVFVPFTCVDNNKNSIIVGAALLGSETAESYVWLLQQFLKVHGRQPILVLTDEDASMKEAVSQVFPDTRHRLCMWHIMNKVPGKVCGNLDDNKTIRSRLTKLVWNIYLDPNEFESQWASLIEEFKLEGNQWLAKKFSIRQNWIPAYFKEVEMCGLMKTTSRSESTNSYFGGFSNNKNNLVQFMFCYDAAIDKQRYRQRTEEHISNTTTPSFKTKKMIEKHAADVYSRKVFFDVQDEIDKAVWGCAQWSVESDKGCQIFTIKQNHKNNKTKSEFKVVHNNLEGMFDCSCKHFQFYGTLCRHVYTVLMNLDYTKIPEQYIRNRWRRDMIPPELLHICNKFGAVDDEAEKLMQGCKVDFLHCLEVLKNDKVSLASFREEMVTLRENVDKKVAEQPKVASKASVIEGLIGMTRPERIEINPPKGIRNKGCGTGKRLIGPGEKAKKERNKRLCRACGKYDNHDSRNCQEKKKKEQENKDAHKEC